MKRILLLCALLALILSLGCGEEKVVEPDPNPINLSAAEKTMVKASNGFAFDMFSQILASEEPDSNVFISPLSISYALGMTYNGARTTTEEAMRDVLGYGNLTGKEINESYMNLTNALTTADPGVTMEIANSIWCRDNCPVEEDFKGINSSYFDAEVASLDFSAPGAADIINGWVSTKTHEKIKSIIDPPIPEAAIMYLINAIYYKATWKYEFDPKNTHKDYFYGPDGRKTIDMMVQLNEFDYYTTDDFQAISLPYGEYDFAMTVFLPVNDNSVDDFLAGFNENSWKNYLSGFSRDSVELYFPKFRIEYGKKLKEDLRSMGMGVAFDFTHADFSGINPAGGIYISEVIHKSFVQVDEEGTEAAAVTSVGMETVAEPGGPKFMAVNKPFVFVIHEQKTGAILFMGRITNPYWNE